MRRSLVLGDETARHPFLQSLPPHVRSGAQPVLRAMPLEEAPPRISLWQKLRDAWQGSPITAADLRLFLLAYCACFLAVSAFIW
jgi:hypothetical protein